MSTSIKDQKAYEMPSQVRLRGLHPDEAASVVGGAYSTPAFIVRLGAPPYW